MEKQNTIRKRADVPVEYTWATEDIFPTEEAWEQAFSQVTEELSSYEAYRGRLGESADALYGCLKLDEEIGEKLDQIYGYAHLKSDVDTGNSRYQVNHADE